MECKIMPTTKIIQDVAKHFAESQESWGPTIRRE